MMIVCVELSTMSDCVLFTVVIYGEHVCCSVMFGTLVGVFVYLDHLKFCVECICGRRYVCCSKFNVVFDECDEPTPRLQTTQPTSGGAVTAVTNCCANCVEPFRP